MNDTNSISIDSRPQLINLLRLSSLDVTWDVRCEIGPDWIGGGREVQLLHDGKRLSGEFCDKLISAVINAASIPDASTDSMISGEGKIMLRNYKFMLEFEWSEAVPYDNPRDNGHGTVELFVG